MKAVIRNIVTTRWDNFSFDFKLNDAVAELVQARCTIKKNPSDAQPVLLLDLDNGITALPDSVYRVEFDKNVITKEMNGYYYDLELEIGSSRYTPLKGQIFAEWGVTNEY